VLRSIRSLGVCICLDSYPCSLSHMYSLRLILLFVNTDVSSNKMCLDKSILAKSIMGWREYYILWHLACDNSNCYLSNTSNIV
jgi:hypothetical protein